MKRRAPSGRTAGRRPGGSRMAAPRLRLTIRARLTLTYGILFTLAGAILLGFVYVWMRGQAYGFEPVNDTTPSGHVATTANTLTATTDSSVIASESELFGNLLQASGLALLVCAVIALGLGWIVAGRVLAPMRRITSAAAGIAARNLHERVRLAGPHDEIKELADTFDGMLERLEAAFAAQRRFAANASHELLTPLAANRAVLQLAAAHPDACDVTELTDTLLGTNRRSEHIIEALLTLARADHGAVNRQDIDLAQALDAAVDRIHAEAASRDITIEADTTSTTVAADPVLLDQLLDNLLRNAIRHNQPGGHVTITLALTSDGAPEVTVANTGPRVPPEMIIQLFEPFVRLDARTHQGHRSGHGIGMAIIQAIAEAHGGALTAHPNPQGGLTITMTFTRQALTPSGQGPDLDARRHP
ncbi:HAMP domain-containing sensor histidine kinase [Streptomyces sp. WAC 06783]|uniref:sensor histidine kinase n=1 Tax=Streptomyces sp. WAC 06783 TaxID=2203211 RepID=UPI000F74B791|nr:HAMP domain-containing sensor histidine kinase [Streptomyces sp. WAC 06783]